MSPRHPGWEAFAESVAPGARVTRMHRLVGGGSADAYDVTLDRAPGRVVVKVFRDGDDTAPLEWSRLQFAQRVTMPVPEPIAADLESTWFGRPAIVMSRLTGRPDMAPKDVDSWIGSLARALTELHETALDGAEGALTRPPLAETWRPPAGQHDSLTSRAVNAVTAHLPSLRSEHVFTHGDFNPSNVLWHGGRISGVVDWSAARLDTRWSELAYCRGRCVSSSDPISRIAWLTRTRTLSGMHPTKNSPCTTSCLSVRGITPGSPSKWTDSSVTLPTMRWLSHTSTSNFGVR